MAVSPKKADTKTIKKATTAESPTVKKITGKKTATKKSRSVKARKISPEERYKMIEVAAYYIAEDSNFEGNAIDFWNAAKKEVSEKFA